ncbi:MAG: homoserine dehydrogenase [Clostridia bacterium]|nr:homoserine dehydrogenase [Clostridia bacterium]
MTAIAILGHGVVGSGVAEVLRMNADSIAEKAGTALTVKRILDLRSFPDLPYADLFTTEFDTILQDEEIRIVVETMGGLHPAYDFVKACLQSGKSVVTSNKELVAAKGDELLKIAQEKNVNFLFEASVGGGIPILRPLAQCLAGNEIEEIAGILNGTTNFMLTRMVQDGMDFESALKLAQDLGYAERNPSADVDGHDACRKICILAALAYGKHVYPDQVYTEGISAITPTDVHYAEAIGRVIKLVGRVSKHGDRIQCMVSPLLIPEENLLAQVGDVFNAVQVRGNAVGDVMFYGRGAGKLPTASAVVGDVIDCAQHLAERKPLGWSAGDPAYVMDHADSESAFMLRFEADDHRTLIDALDAVFGEVEVVGCGGENPRELAVLTDRISERKLSEGLAQLGQQPVSRLRLL